QRTVVVERERAADRREGAQALQIRERGVAADVDAPPDVLQLVEARQGRERRVLDVQVAGDAGGVRVRERRHIGRTADGDAARGGPLRVLTTGLYAVAAALRGARRAFAAVDGACYTAASGRAGAGRAAGVRTARAARVVGTAAVAAAGVVSAAGAGVASARAG